MTFILGDGEPLLGGARGEFGLERPHVVADIEHAAAVAVGLGDENAAALVDAERDGVGEHRLGGPEFDDEALGHPHALDGAHAFVGRGVDLGRGLARAGVADFPRGFRRVVGFFVFLGEGGVFTIRFNTSSNGIGSAAS